MEIDLIKGVVASAEQSHLRIECWTEKPETRGAKFDWKCRISVPGGGLQQNIDEFGFQRVLRKFLQRALKKSDESEMKGLGIVADELVFEG